MKLWNGGGEGNVHSKPVVPICAPSHGISAAFLPPLTVWIMMYRNRMWDNPKIMPPTLDTKLNSVNCVL